MVFIRTGILSFVAFILSANSGWEPVGWVTENGGITGGQGGQEVIVTNAGQLQDAVGASEPMIVKVKGAIQADISINSNKTLEGLEPGAEINGYVSIKRKSNVIVRNLIIKQTSPNSSSTDVIEVSTSTNVWIDHCDISDTRTDTDGLLDIVRGSDFVTVSWCKFSYPNTNSGHRLCMLIGNTDDNSNNDSTHLAVTLHHNWWENNIQERMPRTRYGKIHSFNNYFSTRNNNYCLGAGRHAQLVVESNYFENVKDPHIFYNGEATAQIRINNDNQYVNVSGAREQGHGNSFSIPYEYELDAGADVKSIVMDGVGPFNGPQPPEDTATAIKHYRRQQMKNLNVPQESNSYNISGKKTKGLKPFQPYVSDDSKKLKISDN